MSTDLTYHCDACKERNELADKLDTNPSWLRQHSTHHAFVDSEQLQLFNPDQFK